MTAWIVWNISSFNEIKKKNYPPFNIGCLELYIKNTLINLEMIVDCDF